MVVSLKDYFPWLCKYYIGNRYQCISQSNNLLASLSIDLTVEQTIKFSMKRLGGLI